MKRCERKAYAKINLGLDVIGLLPNGYHQVRMIMQTVNIYDVLTFEKIDRGIIITTNKEELSSGEDNLIYKTAKLMMETYGIVEGVKIHLKKTIPIAAGMAGGSTDAAATFWGISELFDLECTTEELCKLGVKIGADVPYCIVGKTALAEGIGEVLTTLPNASNCILLVAKPDIQVSTKYVYDTLDKMEIKEHPDIDGMIHAIKHGNLDGIVSRLGNVLEEVTISKYSQVQEIKNSMYENGALGALMSGSGPTVFGIYKTVEEAAKAAKVIKDNQLANEIFVTEFYS